MKIIKLAILTAFGSFALQACGGNGGSEDANFTSWDDVGPSETVRADGDVRFATYTSASPVELGAVQERGGQLVVGIDALEEIESTSVDAGDGSVDFDTAGGDVITEDGGLIIWESADGQRVAIFGDPDALGFNYQTFGGWMTGLGTGGGIVGVGTFGNQTANRVGPGGVPGVGEATYEGGAGGVAVNAAGTPFVVVSEALVMVDFTNDEFDFSTFNTVVENLDTSAVFATTDYDLTGGGTISGATLTGNLSAEVDMSGDLTGVFYGPGAPEVGGTYYLFGPAGEYLGAFGAVEVP